MGDPAGFLVAAGQVVGGIAGAGLLGLLFQIGLSWGEVKRDVSSTKRAVERIEPIAAEHAQALKTINQTLHGPEGGNGLYGTVKKLDERFDEIERRLPDHRGRRSTDQ
jgi:hypothetical protein